MPHIEFDIKENDTSPSLEGICRDGFGAPVNMTGANVEFHMRLHPAGAVKISAGAMVAVGSAELGRFKYVWQAGDTDTAGVYEGEVEATFSNGAIRTFPPNGYFLVQIKDDIS